jgi:flagellar hook-basal body complex protein FliE
MDPVQRAMLENAAKAAFKQTGKKPGIEEVGEGFGEIFKKMLGGTTEMQAEARQAVNGMFTGDVQDVHQVMVAVNKASLSFKFLVEVRNKLTEAYKELMAKK